MQTYHTLVIGSGCAGYNAADWLFNLGVKDIALITEGKNMGTSRNTGSDKQTYYKLTLAGDCPDSVYEMAQTLFEGGAVHGDIALAEAVGSATSFMKLVHLGLPFPTNKYGAYIGYKTDHDPRQRATSCGPLTSKLMTEALEGEIVRKNITVIDNAQVVKIHTQNGAVNGLTYHQKGRGFTTVAAQNIILATGGPAGIYADTVFPESQTGGTGLAIDAGAKACNLQEWQYGLASTDFRWNVSGTYQQVLPRYISVDADGNEYEFLAEHYKTGAEALDRVFLKGYQWPFDTRKTDFSSQIDLLVAAEMKEKNRTVYMDFRRNPSNLNFDELSEETYDYLKKSDALFGTPIERLAKMNQKAIDLYKNNGIDLYKEPLKIAVCAQHCNGGVAVDVNWESNIKGLYAAGEAAGSFGVYRPGGSALNAAQVGSMRAAEHIASKPDTTPTPPAEYTPPAFTKTATANYVENHAKFQANMTHYAAYNRNLTEMEKLLGECENRKSNFFAENTIASDDGIPALLKYYDLLLTQIEALSAMILAAKEWGTHGGALVQNTPLVADKSDHVIITLNGKSQFEPVRQIPECDEWFERDWAESLKRRNRQ